MAKVKKIMLSEVPTLGKEEKVEEAARLIVKSGCGCAVIAENKKPVGIVTELDLVRGLASKGSLLKEPVSGIMSSPVTFMPPDMKLEEALKVIDTKKFRVYPVVENGSLIGLVTKKDIVNAASANIKLHRNIQNAVMVIFVLFELFVFAFSDYISSYLSLGA